MWHTGTYVAILLVGGQGNGSDPNPTMYQHIKYLLDISMLTSTAMTSEHDLQHPMNGSMERMRHRAGSLEGKLTLAMAAGTLLVIGSITYVANWLTLRAVEQDLNRTASEMAVVVTDRLDHGLPEPSDLQKVLSDYVHSNVEIEAIAVFEATDEGTLRKLAVGGAPVEEFREQQRAFDIGAPYSRRVTLDGRRLWSVGIPISTGGHKVGAIGVWSPLLAANFLLEQNRRRALVAAPLSIALIVLLFRVAFKRLVHRPLLDLESAMRRAEAGDLLVEASVARKDELGLIARRYNIMLSRIRGSIEEREALHNRAKKFGEELESKVTDATRELEEKNRELRKLNEELYYIQRRLARMERLSAAQHIAARFAHKIGTPLNLISGHIQVLLQARRGDGTLEEKLQLIQSQIEKLETIVRDMLDETRKPILELETFDLNQLLERICALVEPTFAGRGILVDKRFTPHPLTILGDEAQLEQVFLNLFNNSLDAMPGGGTLTVRTGTSKEDVLIEIVDSGEGMTESVLSQMFRPFFTTKEIGRGTGLGLSIVKEIVSAHGATIEAESGFGQGTKFTLIFPATSANDMEVSQNDTAPRRR